MALKLVSKPKVGKKKEFPLLNIKITTKNTINNIDNNPAVRTGA